MKAPLPPRGRPHFGSSLPPPHSLFRRFARTLAAAADVARKREGLAGENRVAMVAVALEDIRRLLDAKKCGG